ncbi:hypothetical protein VE02_07505 [Pseudogymnoascus sp. 03VT05]|nr:hypothetical protein VE02_07505 [Pseudogymnoascus sp. 03VT05]
MAGKPVRSFCRQIPTSPYRAALLPTTSTRTPSPIQLFLRLQGHVHFPSFTGAVKMATHRRNNVNASNITITEYTMPPPLDWFAIGCMLALFGTGVASPWITPGDQIWNLLTQYFPGGPEWVVWIGRTLVPLLALAHVAEVVLFD